MRRASHGRNDCLTDCVACIFNVHPTSVPLFINGKNWYVNLRRYFRRRGYRVDTFAYHETLMPPGKGVAIVQGVSPTNPKSHHVVLYRGRRQYYDPSGRKRGLRGRPLFVHVIRPLVI